MILRAGFWSALMIFFIKIFEIKRKKEIHEEKGLTILGYYMNSSL